MSNSKSEKLTIKLSKQSFLSMHVYNNPNKKCLDDGSSDEFYDCLINMVDSDVVIQVEHNDKKCK